MRSHIEQGLAASEAAKLALADGRLGRTVRRRRHERLPRAARGARALRRRGSAGRARQAPRRPSPSTSRSATSSSPTSAASASAGRRASVSIAQEHFASNVVRGRLLSLARGWDRGSGPRALLACAPGDQHDLPLLMLGLSLRSHGWRISYLGADTPLDSLFEAVDELRPAIAVVSGTPTDAFDGCEDGLREIAARTDLAIAGGGATEEVARASGARLLEGDPRLGRGGPGIVSGQPVPAIGSPPRRERRLPDPATRIDRVRQRRRGRRVVAAHGAAASRRRVRRRGRSDSSDAGTGPASDAPRAASCGRASTTTGVDLVLLGALPLLRFGPGKREVTDDRVACAFPIVGGVLALASGGWLTVEQRGGPDSGPVDHRQRLPGDGSRGAAAASTVTSRPRRTSPSADSSSSNLEGSCSNEDRRDRRVGRDRQRARARPRREARRGRDRAPRASRLRTACAGSQRT